MKSPSRLYALVDRLVRIEKTTNKNGPIWVVKQSFLDDKGNFNGTHQYLYSDTKFKFCRDWVAARRFHIPEGDDVGWIQKIKKA